MNARTWRAPGAASVELGDRRKSEVVVVVVVCRLVVRLRGVELAVVVGVLCASGWDGGRRSWEVVLDVVCWTPWGPVVVVVGVVCRGHVERRRALDREHVGWIVKGRRRRGGKKGRKMENILIEGTLQSVALKASLKSLIIIPYISSCKHTTHTKNKSKS